MKHDEIIKAKARPPKPIKKIDKEQELEEAKKV